jgi:hypothetical protein
MAAGISLHIGINQVDPDHYEGWDGELVACEADARDMAALAKKQGFTSSTLLLTKAATADAVSSAILGAARSLKSGDLFFLSYSGHGGQVNDTNMDEKDRMDETWVCHDRQLVDDELYELWGKFRSGVRIVVFPTAATAERCCATSRRSFPGPAHSGHADNGRPQGQKAHAKLYRTIQDEHRAAENTKVNASVLLISGCMDNQTSLDGERNGLFTGTLKKVWNGGKFKGGYRKLRDTIVSRMPPQQTPNYFVVGAVNPSFEAQRPWTL